MSYQASSELEDGAPHRCAHVLKESLNQEIMSSNSKAGGSSGQIGPSKGQHRAKQNGQETGKQW